MRTYRLGTIRGLSSLVALLLVGACGGGGGDGPAPEGPLVYAGSTSPAVIRAANASSLAADVVGNGDTASTILGISIESSDATRNRGVGVIDLAQRLSRNFRGTVARAGQPNAAQRPVNAVIPVDETDLCDGGNGSVRAFGTLNDDSTGSLTVTFNSCLIESIVLSGTATLQVVAVSSPFPSPTDFTLSFARLKLRGPGLSLDATGSLRAQLSLGTTETITANLVSRNNSTAKMTKTENLRIENVYDNLEMPSFFAATVSGKVFDQDHGFVNITTPMPITFGTLSQLFPDGGQLILAGAAIGAGNRSIRVSALSSTMVWLELDLDGDDVREIAAFLKWVDLSGPVGADLADTDGDGMHNSWETANNGLNPVNPADAALDSDGDGYSNLKEYRGGGNPNSASVVPSLGKVSLTLAPAVPNEFIVGKSGLATDGTKYLLVSCRAAGIFGVFVTGATAGQPFPIAAGNCTDGGIGSDTDITLPSVAFDGMNYLVVFVKGAIIYGTRVSQSGTILDGPSGFPISTGQIFVTTNWSPAIAFDGTNYLVVWNKFNGANHDIYGARVNLLGQAQSEFPISTAAGTQDSPVLAFDGTNYLVAWHDERNGSHDIYAARVTQNDTVLDPSGIAVATTSSLEDSPRISFSGANYLVVWRSVSTLVFDPPLADIRGARIGLDGTSLDGPPTGGGMGINTIALGKSGPALTFDGTNFLVAWVVGAFPNSPPAGMFGAKVSPGGQVVEGLPTTTGIALSGPPPAGTRFNSPVMTSNGASALLAWRGQSNSIPGALIFP